MGCLKTEKIDEKNGIIYMKALGGYHVVNQIIPELYNEAHKYNKDWRIRIELNGSPMEIASDMSVNDIIDCWRNGGNLRQKGKYETIDELVEDVKKLGDWKTEEGVKEYLKVLAKINNILGGYSFHNNDELLGSQTVEGNFPKEVREVIQAICEKKFPKDSDVFVDNHVKEGLPLTANYLPLVHDGLGLSILNERTGIAEIGREMYIYPEKYGKEDATSLVLSVKEFMEKHNSTMTAEHTDEDEF